MPSPAVVLELIGQAILPALGDLAGPPVDRLAREVWSVWSRERDLAGRREDLEALLELSAPMQSQFITDIVRRLLPGRSSAAAALTRYLAALPPLLRWLPDFGISSAEDLQRWLPAHLPRFQAGDKPPGIGDRELIEPVRIRPNVECWLARNPHLPERPPVLLAFLTPTLPELTQPGSPLPALTGPGSPLPALTGPGSPLPALTGPGSPELMVAWLSALSACGGLPLEHTFLAASPAVLQFASPPDDSLPGLFRDISKAPAGPLWRRIVEIVAAMHRRNPVVTLGRLDVEDVFLSREGDIYRPVLFLTEPPQTSEPRHDVLLLGRLGQRMHQRGGEKEEQLAALINDCLATEPLQRPADAVELLARLDLISKPAGRAAVSRPGSGRRSAAARNPFDQVQSVLASLEKGAPKLAKRLTNSIGMTFVLLEGGSFQMGSPPGEPGRREQEGPVHEVLLTRPVYLGIHPVTQQQYQTVMGVNPARFRGAAGGGPDHPVEMVSWDDAVAFCHKLAELPAEKEAGRSYRLPTEAEWEYACRAGTSTPFSTGASLSSTQAAFDGNYPYGDAPRGPAVPRTQRVGSFAPNHFGLYDMHGNVWEWCSDWYDASYYQHSARQDPQGPTEGTYRVVRGGSWRNQAVICRSAYRNALAPNQRQPFIGFRVVMLLGSQSSE